MPLVTIFVSSNDQVSFLESVADELKVFLADKLTCGGRSLVADEFSIQVMQPLFQRPIADIEITISAFAYPARVEQQDSVCIATRRFLEKKSNSQYSFFVWLELSELGHSVEE